MRLKDVLHAEKTVTEWGEWGSGKMPRTAFPLSKSRGNFYRLGSYRWRVIKFEALGASFRLMIALHEAKEQFRAFLGLDDGDDTKFIASYEFHGTHPGWHAVVSCDTFEAIPGGIKTGPWQFRLPSPRQPHRRRSFKVTEFNATDVACDFFRLPREPGEPEPPPGAQMEFNV